MTFPIKNLRLDGRGIAKVLGELEADVMDAVWTRDAATVGEVRADLKPRKDYSFNTIMTVMNRLVEKGILVKRDAVDGGAFSYSSKTSRDAFQRDVTRSVVSAILTDGSLFHAAGFVEAMEDCTPQERALLKKLLKNSR